jgi:hypothetical protein
VGAGPGERGSQLPRSWLTAHAVPPPQLRGRGGATAVSLELNDADFVTGPFGEPQVAVRAYRDTVGG